MNQTEILELRNTINKMKNVLESIVNAADDIWKTALVSSKIET